VINFIVRPLRTDDETEWRRLFTAYLEFYNSSVSESTYTTTFARLLGDDPWMPSAFVAARNEDEGGALLGIVHFLYHSHCWREERVCYLQDLFADPQVRGSGVGRALIEAVYGQADCEGAPAVYWLTQDFNAEARKLYDRIASATPFIKYIR
jgi:GNAT superfamily N-acetyltransferase